MTHQPIVCSGGRSFHSRGPAAEKLLSPSLLCVGGMSSFRMSLKLERSGQQCSRVCVCGRLFGLQCFDAVGWAAGRASGLKKTEWWGAGVVICLERGADLHVAQLMPLPLTVSCFSKIQIGLHFWYRLARLVPKKGPLNGCVCVCACACARACACACACACVCGQLFSEYLPPESRCELQSASQGGADDAYEKRANELLTLWRSVGLAFRVYSFVCLQPCKQV